MDDLTNAALGLHQAAGFMLPTNYFGIAKRLDVTRKLCVNKATAARLRETIKAQTAAKAAAAEADKQQAIQKALENKLATENAKREVALKDLKERYNGEIYNKEAVTKSLEKLQQQAQQKAQLKQQEAELQARQKALQRKKPSAPVLGLPLSLSPLSLVETAATSPTTAKITNAALVGAQQTASTLTNAAASAARGFMNRLTRKNQRLTPAENLAKTRKAMIRMGAPPKPLQPIAAEPTTITSKGIATNLGIAIRDEQNTGQNATSPAEIKKRVEEQRAALPSTTETSSAPSPVISKLDELREIIRNMPVEETDEQRNIQRRAVLAQAQKALKAELAKLTPAQRAEYEARNVQRVAALSSKQQPPSSPRASSSPQQSRR